MKRHRILAFYDFDTRALALEPIAEQWEENVKALHLKNRERVLSGLAAEFGERNTEQKVKNFLDLGPKPMSVIAFHNAFLGQVRTAFVMSSYYPALTGACALGERILNHLVLSLRDDYRSTPEYKRVYRNDSFDDWALAIDTLVAWDVLLPTAEKGFRELMRRRHDAIHFRPETDLNVRELALAAVKCLQEIIGEQFSGFGLQPWFMSVPGEIYIKQDWEPRPFITKVYLKNGPRVGPHHKIESVAPQLIINDPDHNREGPPGSDEEFLRLRKAFNDGGQRD